MDLIVDTEDWPLVYLRYSGVPSEHELARHLREIEEGVLARQAPFLQVIDQRAAEVAPEPRHRELIRRHQEERAVEYREHCRGEVYWTTPETRAAIMEIFATCPPGYPYVFTFDLADTIAWLHERLEESVLSSSGVRGFARRILSRWPDA